MNEIGGTTLDAVIIGAGIAGLTCATRMADHGLSFRLLEKGTDERYPCNTRISGGVFHVAHRDVVEDPATIYNAIKARTGENVDEALISGLAEGVDEAIKWLKACGAKYIKVGQEVYRRHTLAPPIKLGGKDYWLGRGGDALLRTLESALRQKGGSITRGARAKSLLMEGGNCVGVVAEINGIEQRVRARNVVICDGGFQGDQELVARYISANPEQLMQRNSGSGKGDGLRMAHQVGAKIVAPNRFYGHVLSTDAFSNTDFWPFPIMDYICCAAVVVDGAGRRVIDEGLGGVRIVNQLAALENPAGTYVIYDQTIWEGPGKEYLPPTNPTLKNLGGTIHEARSLDELAAKIGIPAGKLLETVAAYNNAVATKATETLNPPRTASAFSPYKIEKGPFYAVRICPGLTYTMGGIGIDAQGHVLKEDGGTIPGLFAAGCTTGGIDGGENVAYIGGLARSAFTGYRCANVIADAAKVV